MDHLPARPVEPVVWVRAMYDYGSEDQTNLSFRAGDMVQVLTILESGWWDGIVHGQRGWFPSNYCQIVTDNEAHRANQILFGAEDGDETSGDDEEQSEDEVPEPPRVPTANTSARMTPISVQTNDWPKRQRDQEEAAFWIPQVTEDGTLFYHNTLTGVSTMELPLESPENETGPRDSKFMSSERKGRASGDGRSRAYSQSDDEEGSASEVESASASESPKRRKRRSYISDGASPYTSMESLSRLNSNTSDAPSSSSRVKSSPGALLAGVPSLATVPARFLDYNTARPLTWDLLLDDIRSSIEKFRHVILNDERSEYVRRAEDISDHVRLILAAGSGTTDNHSGTPSIITSNKALYPRFRDMMSRFARLVLDAHINAGEYSAQDGSSKCLQDADGVMDGVHGYIEVARHQRGEEIPRLFPGFVGDHFSGGNWKNNALSDDTSSSNTLVFSDDDLDNMLEPDVRLDDHVVAQMDEMRKDISLGLKKLDGYLVVQDKLISRPKHFRICTNICNACQDVLELYQPWMANLESITLSALGSRLQTPQLADFAGQKQQVYNLVADLVMVCQAVSKPLADEWAANRGLPLEDRVKRVRSVSKELESATSHVSHALQTLLDSMPPPGIIETPPGNSPKHGPSPSVSSKGTGMSAISDVSLPDSTDGNSGMMVNAGNRKGLRIFGQVPVSPLPSQSTPGTGSHSSLPPFMGLDHEGEIQYDTKTDPPSVKGGTITGLVEQLTRHDAHQDSFRIHFLLTFRSFMSAKEVFQMLVQRWSIQPRPGLTEEEYAIWAEKKQAPIRFRVCNTLKLWMESYWMEDDNLLNKALLHQIYDFAQNTIETSNMSWANNLGKALLILIDMRIKGQEPHSKKMVASFIEGPTPKLPKNMKKFKIVDIDPTELARQLTIIESRLYCSIKPQECLDKSWTRKVSSHDADPAPNVKVFIRHSNQLTYWVIGMILGQTEVKKRVAVVKHFVAVGEHCLQMNNFSTLTAIVSAFSKSPVFRLHRTWSTVDKKTRDSVARLRQVTDSTKNFKTYRDLLHRANPPVIPFLGIYLQDLTFMEDGNPSRLKGTDLINFSKRTKIAEVIREIVDYQNITYPFKSIPEIQSYITDKMQHTDLDDEAHYIASAKVEPREREDEKIARLLTESGFL